MEYWHGDKIEIRKTFTLRSNRTFLEGAVYTISFAGGPASPYPGIYVYPDNGEKRYIPERYAYNPEYVTKL